MMQDMSALRLHLDVARELEKAVQADRDEIDCKPALLKLQEHWGLEAVFLFTFGNKESPDKFQIHSLTTEKPTPFQNINWDADSLAFVADVQHAVVLAWKPLKRLAYERDALWELIWQSMVLGPYPGPWELSAVVFRKQPSMDFAGLLILVRDSSNAPPACAHFDLSLKLLAHQFYISERWHLFKKQLAAERDHFGSEMYNSLLSRARGDFAHGVFAKLQTIGLLAENTRTDVKKGNQPAVLDALDAIDGLKEEILRLIKDVLSLETMTSARSTGQASRPGILAEWVDVRESVGMIERALSPLARMSKKTFTIRIEPPSKLPMFKKDFDEILSNLVHNAIKYSGEPSKIKITLSHGTRRSMLDITSYGIEIPKEDRERIFERGYRTREAAAISFNALGIGLFQARRLAEAAGARLSVQASEELTGQASATIRIQGQEHKAFRNTFRLLVTK